MLIILLQNVSVSDTPGDEPASRYQYQVRVNERVIEEGVIEGHVRSSGWRPLIQKLLEARA